MFSLCAVSSNANESQPGVQEDAIDDDEGFPIIPYERLKTDSANPISEIDSSKREVRVQYFNYIARVTSHFHSFIQHKDLRMHYFIFIIFLLSVVLVFSGI